MKLSNFTRINEGLPAYAEVDVTTGFWFWKKTERKIIVKEDYYWYFVDCGKLTPGYQAEALEHIENEKRLYKSKE